MAWRHHDSSVAVPFLGPREYNASDIAKLRELSTMADWTSANLHFESYKVFVYVSMSSPTNHSLGETQRLGARYSPQVVFARKLVSDKGGQGNADASFAIKGHGDNQGGLSGLQTQPSPAHHSGRCLDTVEEPGHENVVLEMEASKYFRFLGFLLCNPVAYFFLGYFVGRFGNLPLLINGGSRIQATWITRVLLSSGLRSYYSCKDVKDRYKECKKELAATERITQLEETLKQSEDDAHQLRVEKERYAVEAGRGEMVRQRIVNQYLPTFVRRLHQSAEYKRLLGEVFSLAVGKGFIDGISIGREDADIQAILKATPNVDPASYNTFMDAYVKLFDRRYPYVDKVARMYLLDTSGLQNIMPDETGPTPGGGPHDTPTTSYA
ncbi:hypothetical protein Tco_0909848 [Tanacetum coccineum]|uniref:Uncharacterized protein n=1 Tax=Tanacetum coccineum TaxID=301880 RepID=A0ABQ5CRM3_9ASTR